MNQIRFDNYSNLMSGLGIGSLDRSSNTFYNSNRNNRSGLARHWASRYSLYDVGDLYLSKGIASKIVDRPANDCFQRGMEIEGDDDDLMSDEFDRLSVFSVMSDCVRWTRLYGGSAVLLIAKDGGDFSTPLNLNTLDLIEQLKVLDLTQIKPTQNFYTDPTLSNYGQLEFYTLTPPGAESFLVHESRIIPMGGDPLPGSFSNQNQLSWAGRSALEGCLEDISRYEQALDWSLRLLERKQQGVYAMDGLAQMMAEGDTHLAVNRMNMVDMVRSNLNSVMIDNEDTYNVQDLSLSGIETVLNEYQVALSASSNIPIAMLFGKSSTGLNATGAGDLESYYSMVAHIQRVIAKPSLEKLTSILWMQSHLKTKIPDEWQLIFNPLWAPSEKEVADTQFVTAQANNTEVTMLLALLTNGILDPEEVRKIIVTKYAEYNFPDTVPSSGADMNYSEAINLQNELTAKDKVVA